MSRALIATERLQEIVALDETIQESRRQIREAEAKGSPMLKGLLLASSMQMLRNQMTLSMMADLMPLVGSPLGIMVVPPEKKYEVETIRDVVIEGLLKGYRPVGGEMCVFSGGKFYPCAPGNLRLVQEWPGLTDLRLEIGVPKGHDGGALVPVIATWKLDGTPDGFNCTERDGQDWRIPVKVNAGMGVDAIIGKAKAKLWSRILSRLSGSSVVSAEDAADGGVVDGTFISAEEQPQQNEPHAAQEIEQQKPDAAEATDTGPLDDAASMLGACHQLGDVARCHRHLIQTYPDYQDQIDELAEHHKERIRSRRLSGGSGAMRLPQWSGVVRPDIDETLGRQTLTGGRFDSGKTHLKET